MGQRTSPSSLGKSLVNEFWTDILVNDMAKIMSRGTWNMRSLQKFKIERVRGKETNHYIHLYSGVNKKNRAMAGVSILIKKNLNGKMWNWNLINERIILIKLCLKGYKIVALGM